jgi:hypothetical protein
MAENKMVKGNPPPPPKKKQNKTHTQRIATTKNQIGHSQKIVDNDELLRVVFQRCATT